MDLHQSNGHTVAILPLPPPPVDDEGMTSQWESLGSDSPSTFPISGIFSPPNTCNSHPGNLNSPPPACKVNSLCFSCQQAGHWARKCPNRTPTARRQLHFGPPSSPPSAGPSPVVYCPCGGGICNVKVSRKPRSSGRKFYSCPLYPANSCKFFKWYDELSSDDLTYDVPTCECGAGPCHVYRESDGPNAGRKFFVCPIKKCLDESKHSSTDRVLVVSVDWDRVLVISDDWWVLLIVIQMMVLLLPRTAMKIALQIVTSLWKRIFQRKTTSKDRVLVVSVDLWMLLIVIQTKEIGSSVVNCLERAPKFGIIFEPPRKDRIPLVDSQGREDTSDEPLRNRYKRLRCGNLKSDGFALNITSDGWDVSKSKPKVPTMVKALRTSVLTLEPSRPQKRLFLGQISPAGSSLTGASSTSLCYNSPALRSLRVPVTWNYLESAVHQILGFQFGGSDCQLLFPPSRSLTIPSPKPFFCSGISPSFDPIWDPQDVNVSNAEAAAIVPYSQSSAEPNKQSLLLEQPSKTLQGNKITEPIEETFQNAAKQIQNKLLTVLELTDFRDHKTMASDASSVFRALDGLLVDYQPFKQLVMEFVGTAASLAEAELSIQEDNTLQQVVDKYNCQKQHLENISHLHAETAAALEASTEHLESLRKEVVLVKAMLCRIEEKLLSCEAENVEILYRLEEVNEDKLKSQQRLLVAAAEVEEARKLVQKRDAAEASFKAAKLQLQQSFNES
ncbi:uncharacterized protein LOC127801430 isoform X5 [Diospyros lotus]|uniref:uncharacterized protein LOC127801430 isoform X5 n=1 Tax=Diospyros lotus TaxID=55363 RepID=UPI00225B0CCE|nr:uncharacterized protein LOC127801430 isoform X5 [Diospyros lotus]